MADIVGNMFGVKTPQEMQQSYLDSMLVSPGQMGSQGLLQQLISMSGNLGAQAGTGIGRMFGGKAPGEVKAAAVEQALAEVNKMGLKSEADKYAKLAELLGAAGYGAEAMQAAREAQNVRNTDLQTKANQQKLAQGKVRYETRHKTVRVPKVDALTGRTLIGPNGQPIMEDKSISVTDIYKWDDNKQDYVYVGEQPSSGPVSPVTPTEAGQARADFAQVDPRRVDGANQQGVQTPQQQAPVSVPKDKKAANAQLGAAVASSQAELQAILENKLGAETAPAAPTGVSSPALAGMGRAIAERSGVNPGEAIVTKMEAAMNNPQQFAAVIAEGKAMGYSDADLRRMFYARMANRETKNLAKRYPAKKENVTGQTGFGLFR